MDAPQGKTIVIVEDETVLQKALSIELLSDGITVFAASNGKAGLELVREKKPDLVLRKAVMQCFHQHVFVLQ